MNLPQFLKKIDTFSSRMSHDQLERLVHDLLLLIRMASWLILERPWSLSMSVWTVSFTDRASSWQIFFPV